MSATFQDHPPLPIGASDKEIFDACRIWQEDEEAGYCDAIDLLGQIDEVLRKRLGLS